MVPIVALARGAGLPELAGEHRERADRQRCNPGMKVTSLVAGMVTGADSIDYMALLRHGGMGKYHANSYASSTLGSFLRSFTFGRGR